MRFIAAQSFKKFARAANAARVFLRLRRRQTAGLVAVFAAVGALAAFEPAAANWFLNPLKDVVIQLFGWVIWLYVSFVSWLILLLSDILIQVAQYDKFVDTPAVVDGWLIVRDLTNMFFIVILLVLAFGTMLGVEGYTYKNRMLVRLLIVAVVINFSRTICGLLIDASQVVMMTFVNGFKAAAGGNFVDAFQLTDMLNENKSRTGASGATQSTFGIIMSFLLAAVVATVALGVFIVMLVFLVARIIYLWMLIILSPLAFFLRAVPGGKASGYYSEWWGMLTSNLITGPILAFFLWLALLTVQKGDIGTQFKATSDANSFFANQDVGALWQGDKMIRFIVATAMMALGVKLAQKAGGAGVALGKSIAMKAGRFAKRAAWKTTKFVGRQAVSIPLVKDKESGKRVSLVSLGGAYRQRLSETGFGKRLGLNKEYTENIKKERNIAALRISGQHDAANRAAVKLTNERASQLEGKYTPVQLRKIMDSKDASQLDRQGAMLALAQKGDLSLKDRVKEIGVMAAQVSGGKNFEMFETEVRVALKKAGVDDAMLGAGDRSAEQQIKDRLATGSKADTAKTYVGISDQVGLDADGRPLQTFAQEKLRALDSGTFKGFRTSLQDEIKKALMLSFEFEVETDQTKKDEIKKKYEQLNGAGSWITDGADTKAKGLKIEMDGKRAKGRVAARREGEEKDQPSDIAAVEVLMTQSPPAVETAYMDLDAFQSALSKGMPIADSEIKKVMDALVKSAGAGPSGFKDEAGNDLTNAAVVERSTIYKDLDSAREAAAAGQPADVEKLIQAAKIQMGRAISSQTPGARLTPADLQATRRTVKRVKSGLEASRGDLQASSRETDPGKRLKEIKAAAKKAVSSLNVLVEEAKVPPSPALAAEFDKLYVELEALKGTTEITPATAAKVNDIAADIERLSKQL